MQILWSSHQGSRRIEHLGSAHDNAQLEALKPAASQRLAKGQQALDLGLDPIGTSGGPLEIASSRSGHLWDGVVALGGAARRANSRHGISRDLR